VSKNSLTCKVQVFSEGSGGFTAAVLPARSVTGTLSLMAQQILRKCVFVCACTGVRMTLINPYPDIWHGFFRPGSKLLACEHCRR